MSKKFNVAGLCLPELHYMADITERLERIKDLVDQGEYLTINRARQYGKTTTLWSLKNRLSEKYCVFLISFEGMTKDVFRNETTFCKRFYSLLSSMFKHERAEGIPAEIIDECNRLKALDSDDNNLFELSEFFTEMCIKAERRIVLMIDEVDQASNYEVFLGFLGMLRDKYLKRVLYPTFQSVILAGVYDIKNIKMKIRQKGEHQYNSPWNIAADFNVNMSLSVRGIAGMLAEYEKDFQTGMHVSEMAEEIYDYTSGYPFLVSRICKLIDEVVSGSDQYPDKSAAWTKSGFLAAVRILLSEDNTLFSSLDNKLIDYPELKRLLWELLLRGKAIEYVPGDMGIRNALMFGFVVMNNGTIQVANRIFEIRLYNGFLAEKAQDNEMSQVAVEERNQFITNGHLNMELVISKFITHYGDLFGGDNPRFLEDDGRSLFLLYIKPIINGVGNYYIETRTRNNRRTDLIIDYRGEQFIVELKIWRGEEYNQRGEQQLADYLDLHHAQKGYLISFNFNKNKKVGVRELKVGDKILIEAVI